MEQGDEADERIRRLAQRREQWRRRNEVETPTQRQQRLARARVQRQNHRQHETPRQRDQRLSVMRVRDRARRRTPAAQTQPSGRVSGTTHRQEIQNRNRRASTAATALLASRVLEAVDLTPEEIDCMAQGQQFTSDPRLALAYYYCCSTDPNGFVFGDEQLCGEHGERTRARIQTVLDDCPTPLDVGLCHNSALEFQSEGTDIWACASCGRILLDGRKKKVIFRRLCDLKAMLRLDQHERDELFEGIPEEIVRAHRQVLFDGDDIYFLIPELVRDRDRIPLCEKCNADAKAYKFSVASGHDYGRIGDLPELSGVAVNCITPVRCFGIEFSLSGKHSSGHSICFPSNGPVEVVKVLPNVDRECLPRVTFVGPREEWRIQQHKYRKLFDLPVDAVYKWLHVLSNVNNVFREEEITVDDSPKRRSELHTVETAIRNGVTIGDSAEVQAVEDYTASGHVHEDHNDQDSGPRDEAMDDCSMAGNGHDGDGIVLRHSAVIPLTLDSDTHLIHDMIDAMLEVVSGINESGRVKERPVIPVKRGATPMVEWIDNAKLLAGVFPTLFITGSGPLPSGSLPNDYIDHLMNYWDGRFERSTQFVAVLFNQKQRHATVQKAARAGKTHGSTMTKFGKLASTPEFKQALQFAKDHPESAEAKRLNARLLRLLSLVGGSIPFSPFERLATRAKLGAMRYRYGVAEHWVTIAPPEHDDLLLHRVASLRSKQGFNDEGEICVHRRCRFDDLTDELRFSAQSRLAVANRYPVLAAQVFERALASFSRDIIRCPENSTVRVSRNYLERVRGLYGHVAAFNAVVEPQADGRLHAHVTVYGQRYTPELLTRISCCPELWPQARRWLDAVSCTWIPPAIRRWGDDWQASHAGKPARAFEIPLPEAGTNLEEFFTAAQKRVLSTNTHTHSHTCRKGFRGLYMCRLCRPAGIHEGETQPLHIQMTQSGDLEKGERAKFVVSPITLEIAKAIDALDNGGGGRLLRDRLDGAILWEQHRPATDSLFVETNLGLASILASHTNSAIINGKDSGDIIEEYQQAYMTKEQGGLKSATTVMLTALQDMEKYPSTADDQGSAMRDAKYLATRTVNAFTGAAEWSHSLMAYALAGHRSYSSSESFWFVFPHALVSFVDHGGSDGDHSDTGGDDTDSARGDSRSGGLTGFLRTEDASEGGQDENGATTDEGEFVDYAMDGRGVEAQLESLITESCNSHATTTPGGGIPSNSGARMYKVGTDIVMVAQADSYRHRGESFKDYSAIEFEMIVDLLPRVEQTTSGLTRGRPKRRGFDLALGHPLSPTYQGFIRTKFRTAMLGGAPMPTLTDNRNPSTALSKYILCAVVPWCTSDGRPMTELNGRGLLRICQKWNQRSASFVNRQRYRFVEHVLQKAYRSHKNEQTCSSWRSRNADLWLVPGSKGSQKRQNRRQYRSRDDADDDVTGALRTQAELYGILTAAAAKNQRAIDAVVALRATLEALIPCHRPDNSRISGISRVPIYRRPTDPMVGFFDGGAGRESHDTLGGLAQRIQQMPPTQQIDKTELSVAVHSRGDAPNDGFVGGEPEAEERHRCSPDQRLIFDRIVSCVEGTGRLRQTLTMLQGGGGTGKSTLVGMISCALSRHGIATVNTCPTGIGASHLDHGRTFHSAFKVFSGSKLSRNDLELLRLSFTSDVGLIVVDEVSMLSAENFVLMDRRLRLIYQTNTPFGGRSILLVGDFLQLDVTAGTPLCKTVYVQTVREDILAARGLLSKFRVVFLSTQQRASHCMIQQDLLAACRVLPPTYPQSLQWSLEEKRRFRPITTAIIHALTRPLTAADIARDPSWLDDMTILVTSNHDRAALTGCASRMFARRHSELVFRWKRQLICEISSSALSLVYDEDANPLLFAYFVAGAPGQVLDNNNGNVGWSIANGTPCRYHSLGWDEDGKTKQVVEMIKYAREAGLQIVNLPFPPDFINVQLIGAEGELRPAELWPHENNLEDEWVIGTDGERLCKKSIIIPVGLCRSAQRKQSVLLGRGIVGNPQRIHYLRHAADLAFVMSAWKAQGATLKRVLLCLEPADVYARKWAFEHVYVGMSRVTSAEHLRCMPLSGAFRRSQLRELRPNIYTTKWRMDHITHGNEE